MRLARDGQVKAGGFGKRAEVVVSGEESDAAVQATLGDQGTAEARFSTFRQNSGAELTGTEPNIRGRAR